MSLKTRGVFSHCSEARATKITQEVSGLVITTLIPTEMSGAKARTFGGFNRDTFNALSTRRRESSLKRDSVNCTWRWYPESFRAHAYERASGCIWASHGVSACLLCISVEYHSTFLAARTTLGQCLRREMKTDAREHRCCSIAVAIVFAHLEWLCTKPDFSRYIRLEIEIEIRIDVSSLQRTSCGAEKGSLINFKRPYCFSEIANLARSRSINEIITMLPNDLQLISWNTLGTVHINFQEINEIWEYV